MRVRDCEDVADEASRMLLPVASVSPDKSMVWIPAVKASALSLMSIAEAVGVPWRKVSTVLARAKLTEFAMVMTPVTFIKMVSVPEPPVMLSFRELPDTKSPTLVKTKVSLPAPPVSVSTPLPPIKESSAAPPVI